MGKKTPDPFGSESLVFSRPTQMLLALSFKGKLQVYRKLLFHIWFQGDTPEELYEKVKDVIQEQSGDTIWVPSKAGLSGNRIQLLGND